MLLFRDGVNLRLKKDYAGSLKQLRHSYALWPHPLTIVQIGLTHEAAGREVEYRKANARALAIAERTRGKTARAFLRRGHIGDVAAVAFHPTRPVVASGSDDETVKLWDLRSGRVLRTLAGHGGPVRFVAFTPDGPPVPT